jgi:hypothetical protein
MPFVEVDAELGYEGKGGCELGKREHRESELADADNPKSELGDREDPAGKLSDGDYSFSRNRHTVGTIFEGHMEKRQSENGSLGLVLIPPTIPFFARRVGSPALGTGNSLLRHLMPAISAWSHLFSPRRWTFISTKPIDTYLQEPPHVLPDHEHPRATVF